ncbi:MAG: glycosyltransferase [Verrucomicrobia bacterium]|nr:MAG: glycosyltransferase [Verrucomicrobiota bacterium]
MKASILFITYNHRRFVAEAIRSAIAQDYPELELVVCDDGSSDGTLAIIEEELRNCPAHITIVRASMIKNIGLLPNFNQGVAACSGDIIIPMAGDDISLPHRVSKIVAEFAANSKCTLVYSNWTRIDEVGDVLAGSSKHKKDMTFSYGLEPNCIYAGGKGAGCAAAYRADVFRIFGPLDVANRPEDRSCWVRALLLGEIRYLAEPLLKWRSHSSNVSNYRVGADTPSARKRTIHDLLGRQNYVRQFSKDIRLAVEASIISPKTEQHLLLMIRRDRETQRLRRFSLAEAPWQLWFGSSLRLVTASPSFKTLRRIIFGDLMIRVSDRRRERRWKKRIYKGRS